MRLFGRDIPLGVAMAVVGVGVGVAAVVVTEKREVKRIVTNLQPQPLTPVKPSILSGRFEDEHGAPVKIKMGRFLVIQKLPGKPPTPVRGGLIGPGVSEFQATIDVRGLPPGDYDVIVSDSMTG